MIGFDCKSLLEANLVLILLLGCLGGCLHCHEGTGWF